MGSKGIYSGLIFILSFSVIYYLKSGAADPSELAPLGGERGKASQSGLLSEGNGRAEFMYDLDYKILRLVEDQRTSANDKVSALFKLYLENKNNPTLARYYIESMSSLVPGPDIRVLIDEFKRPETDPSIKIYLLRIIGRDFEGDPKSSSERLLQEIAASGDAALAKEASLIYARVNFDSSKLNLLGDALRRGLIDESEFIQEVSPRIQQVNGADQNAITSKLISMATTSRSPDAIEKLAYAFGLSLEGGAGAEKISTEAKVTIKDFLESNPPNIIAQDGRFDMNAAVQYSNWLNARAALASKTPEDKQAFIIQEIVTPANNSNKAAAMLLSVDGPILIEYARNSGQLSVLQSTVQERLQQLPRQSESYTVYKDVAAMLGKQ